MTKKLITWTAVSILIMLGLPFLTVLLASDAGMMMCFMLFFAVNPMYSVIIGAAAGKAMSKLWMLPIISSVLFLVGVWIFFAISEVIFLIYALVYLVLGMVAMLISSYINKQMQRKEKRA